jgi:hypothetical protein
MKDYQVWIADDEIPGDVAPLSWAREWPMRPGQGRRNIIVWSAARDLATALAALISRCAGAADISVTHQGSRWLVARVQFC